MDSLRFRLTALVTVLLIFVVGVPLLWLVHVMDENYRTFYEKMLESVTQTTYEGLYTSFMQNDPRQLSRRLEELAQQPQIHRLRLLSRTGQLLFCYPRMDSCGMSAEKEEPILRVGSTDGMELFVRQEHFYLHRHPIFLQSECLACHQPGKEPIGFLEVELAMNEPALFYPVIKKWTLLSALFIVLGMWAMLSWLYQKEIGSPLQRILQALNRMGKGDQTPQLPEEGSREFVTLARSFNQMLKRLQEAREKEERWMQEQLARADRLVTLGEVAAEIAHEVNNPAAIIRARAEYVRDELLELGASDDLVEDLNILIHQTERIAQTTQSVLHYARKLPQKFEQVDLNRVVQEALNVLNPRFAHREVQVQFWPSPQPAWIMGNAAQLQQVVCNLVNNSLDAVPPGEGRIEIEIRKISAENAPARFQLIVRDNGPGIAPIHRQRIFEPFFTTKEPGKGTGLGLFIVKNIVANHGGTIQLLENHPQGAAFCIELEAAHEAIANSGRG